MNSKPKILNSRFHISWEHQLENAAYDSIVQIECPYCECVHDLEADATGPMECHECEKTFNCVPVI